MIAGRAAAYELPLLAIGLCLLTPSYGSAQWSELEVPTRPVASAEMVEAGQTIYETRCWFCHGEDADGDGPVARYLWPRPRDFTLGSYKLRTTQSGELPTDEDLFRTVTLGIPGTAMPEWGSALSEEDRWQVISYIKTFAADLFEDEAFDPYNAIVALGSPPRGSTETLIAAGREIYDEAKCWECHGALGRGDGEKAPELTDDWDFPIWAADLQTAWKFKGGSTARDIYLRFTTGLDGTPMPSYVKTLSEEQRWQLAYHTASLSDASESARAPGAVITARRIDGDLPSSPDDPAWETAAEVSIPLSGQATFAPRWQIPAVTDLTVRAVHTAEQVALRLEWNDRFADSASVDPALALADGWSADDTYPVLYPEGERVRGVYSDALEIMFPARYQGTAELPHLVYGSAGQPVDLWRWRSDLQNASASQSVTELRAAGIQQPPEPHTSESQRASGKGTWRDGRWTVVIHRPLDTGEGAREVQLEPGAYVPIAFHVWEGSNGETGLKMAISSWYFLHLREEVPATSYLLVLLVVTATATLEYGFIRWLGRRAQLGRLAAYGVRPIATDARAGV